MTYVCVVFWKDKWLPLFLKYFENHLPKDNDFALCCAYTDTDFHGLEDKFHVRHKTDVQNHPAKLNKLAEIVSKEANDSDIIIFMDSDCLLIDNNWYEKVKEGVRLRKFMAVIRPENNGDKQPHPCFAATTVGFWKKIQGDWGAGGSGWLDSQGRVRKDTGSIMLDKLYAANTNWKKIRRTYGLADHPMFFGVYGDFVYHHGAGSRPSRCRWDLDRPDPQAQINKNKQESQEIFAKLKEGKIEFKTRKSPEKKESPENLEKKELTFPSDSEFSGWSIDKNEWFILELLAEGKRNIVEFGAGVSTKLFTQLCPDVVTYEHNKDWGKKFEGISDVRYFGQNAVIDVPINRKFDLAFVDGPPAAHINNGKLARYNTLLLAKYLSDDIVLHDAKREGERNTVNELFSSGWTTKFIEGSKRGLLRITKNKPFDEKLCFCTVIKGEGFYRMAKVMMKTLRQQLKGELPPMFVFHKGLCLSEIQGLEKIYPNIQNHPIDVDFYIEHQKGYPKFWSLESFRLKGFNKIIFFDADLLFTGSIDGLLEVNPEYIAMAHEQKRNVFNSGVVVINGKIVGEDIFQELIAFQLRPDRFGKDQQVLNSHFEGKIQEFSRKYNYLVSELNVKDIPETSVVHYIYKPVTKIRSGQLKKGFINLWEEKENE